MNILLPNWLAKLSTLQYIYGLKYVAMGVEEEGRGYPLDLGVLVTMVFY